jgi:xanthine dehydrogenase accessory factor
MQLLLLDGRCAVGQSPNPYHDHPPVTPARDVLRETFDQLETLRAVERRVAMATLVTATGTTPRKEGAKMWVGEAGRVLGAVTIGGCVDARVLEASGAVLASGRPTLMALGLSDADAFEIGLTCGGTVEVLLEPVALDDPQDPVLGAYAAVRAERDAGRRAVAVAPLAGPVARLVVKEDGSTVGSLGAAPLDAAARAAALDVLERGASYADETGAVGLRRFFELHAPPTTLIVFGAGHVAIPLIALAHTLGWRTVIVDARERYATRERFPGANEIRVGLVEDIANALPYDRSTIVVLTAHDYKFEVPVLRTILRRGVGYIGLLGSRKRGRAVLDFLAAEGFSAEELTQVHVPVGLDLGAETAAEIALAAVAEALAVRNGRAARPLRDRA